MPILLITDKDLIGHILGTKSGLLKDAMYELMEKWLGDGVLTCKRMYIHTIWIYFISLHMKFDNIS